MFVSLSYKLFGLEYQNGNQLGCMLRLYLIEWFKYLERARTVDTILVAIKEILYFGMFRLLRLC